MAKFVIECPSCGKYAEARTGFFARKKVECVCGYIIDVRTDKLAGRECPHCGNTVVFDQSKGEKALCPVCHKPINTQAEQTKTEEFSCVQCGVRLHALKTAETYICPVCDRVNNVAERLMAEKIKRAGQPGIIKYEGNNETLVWKHPIEDFSMGTQLIVHESQEAVFLRDGQVLDVFGPGRYALEVQQLPKLEELCRISENVKGTFHSEVYYINKTVQMAIKWGTPDRIRFVDPLTDAPLEIGASGELNLQAKDSYKLLVRLVGTKSGISWEEKEGFSKSVQNSFRPLIANVVKTHLPAIIRERQIDLLEIDEHADEISQVLLEKLRPGFEEYGLEIPQFYLSHVVLPEDDPNFKRIRELHTVKLQSQVYKAEAQVKTAQAQSETIYRTAQEESKAAIAAAQRKAELERQATETEIARQEAERKLIAAQAEAQAKQMAGMSEAAVMQAKGYSQKDVMETDVKKAYAAGLGQMGSNGSGAGDILGLCVAMGAMGGIADMTREAVAPMFGKGSQPVAAAISEPALEADKANTWDCSCGQKGISGKFCTECGASRPAPEETWNCTCGAKGLRGKFCPECGAKRPEKPDTWNCACGVKGLQGKFCPECGAKRPEKPDTWDCVCGQKGIVSRFCPECGRKKGNGT